MSITNRPLGRTGVQVTPLCLGSMMFGGKTSAEESYAIIDRALDAGINFIDTSNSYGRGKSEEAVGEALKRNGRRDSVVLATKVYRWMNKEDPNSGGLSRRHIISACEASLRRLQTDHIDLYQLHRPQPEVPIDETLRALDDLVRSGKVRYIGTSTFASWQIMEALWTSKANGLHRFISEQPPYNLLDRRIERELVPMAQTYGLAILPWSPLGGGLLTGKYQRDTVPPENSRFSNVESSGAFTRELYQGTFEVLEPLQAMADSKGIPLSQLSLAWVLQQPGITAPLIGPRTMEQLEDNLQAMEIRFSDEELEQIDTIIPPGRMVSPFYDDADFGPHPLRL